MCPRTLAGGTYDVYMCSHTAIHVFATLLYVVFSALLYICPHTLAGGTHDVYMCSHNAIYVFSYCYICVLIHW
jgi:hypothetical protein